MEKFSYLDEFNHVTNKGTSRKSLYHAPTEYCLFVGEHEPRTFLNCGEYFQANFSTQRDAEAALNLVRDILKMVDENVSQSLDLSVVRDEILAAVGKKFDVDGDPDDPDILNLRPGVINAIETILNYYIDPYAVDKGDLQIACGQKEPVMRGKKDVARDED